MRKSIVARSVIAIATVILFAGSLTVFAQGPSKDEVIRADLMNRMTATNARLQAKGEKFRVEMAEYYTDEAGKDELQVVFFNDRGNKQLGSHWVKGDPRRQGRTNITYVVDQVDASAQLPIGVTTAAIDRAMTTWNNVQCSTLPIAKVGPIPGLNLGVLQGAPGWAADITHAGWLGLAPGVLGVTFTFNWIDGGGNLTDINNDKKADTAFREIYYNIGFSWAINSTYDVETIALHEAGHALSQGHFGKAFGNTSNGKVHFAPRAVMNAAYSGVQQSIAKTDNAGHCSTWAKW